MSSRKRISTEDQSNADYQTKRHRVDNELDLWQTQITFVVGANITPKDDKKTDSAPLAPPRGFSIQSFASETISNASSTGKFVPEMVPPNAGEMLPKLITVPKAYLKYGAYPLGGKIAQMGSNNFVDLPNVHPKVIGQTLEILRNTKHTLTANIDNLITVIVFAVNLEDEVLQNKIIERLYKTVKKMREDGEDDAEELARLRENLIIQTKWAYKTGSEARKRVRGILTMCLAWVCSSRLSRGEKEAYLSLTKLKDVKSKMPKQWAMGEFQKCWVDSLFELQGFNEDRKGWNLPSVKMFLHFLSWGTVQISDDEGEEDE